MIGGSDQIWLPRSMGESNRSETLAQGKHWEIILEHLNTAARHFLRLPAFWILDRVGKQVRPMYWNSCQEEKKEEEPAGISVWLQNILREVVPNLCKGIFASR